MFRDRFREISEKPSTQVVDIYCSNELVGDTTHSYCTCLFFNKGFDSRPLPHRNDFAFTLWYQMLPSKYLSPSAHVGNSFLDSLIRLCKSHRQKSHLVLCHVTVHIAVAAYSQPINIISRQHPMSRYSDINSVVILF